MRVSLVEPYYGGSHQAWADGYMGHSRHDVVACTLPARFWKWRMHGSFLTLAEDLRAIVATDGPPDVILASSMLDVAAFAGAIRRIAPGAPIALFFHESQFTYPLSPADRPDLTYAMKNWASAAVADLVVFNSEYHRDLFRTEARRFLRSFPDHTQAHLVDDVLDRAIVLPVGVDVAPLVESARAVRRPPLIVWNHRWEHDKGPDDLRAIAEGLLERRADFTMAMCGEVFVTEPDEFAVIADLIGDRLIHRGWAERSRYVDLLRSASVVLSTAHQEFFGIGVIEGIAAGAHPVLPNRLVYPERVTALDADPATVLYDTPPAAVDLIEAALKRPDDPALRRATMRYDWSTIAPRYDRTLEELPDP